MIAKNLLGCIYGNFGDYFVESCYRNRTLECTKCKYRKRLHDLLSKGNGRITTSIRGAGDGLICCQEKNIQNYPRKAEDCSVFARDGYKCVPNSQCGRGPPDSGPRNEKPVVIRYGNLGSWVYLRQSIYVLAIKSGTGSRAVGTGQRLCSLTNIPVIFLQNMQKSFAAFSLKLFQTKIG